MTTSTQTDVPIYSEWVDIVNDAILGNASLSAAEVKIQNKAANGEPVFVVFGGASAPLSDTGGDLLCTRGACTIGVAQNIWVRSQSTQVGQDYVGVTLLEG